MFYLPSLIMIGQTATSALPWWATNWFEMVMTAAVTMVLPFVLKLLNDHSKAFQKSHIDETALDFVHE